jgi:hypothetical protein
MKSLLLILMLAFSFSVFGQKTISELKPAHASALKLFLSKNKDYSFLSEKAFDADTLRQYRKDFGKHLIPYYRVGDFNRDGISDFALVLSRKGGRTINTGEAGSPYEFNRPLAVVIFNGAKNGTFRNAFIEKVDKPLVSFLSWTPQSKEPLSFAVYATDDYFMMKPVSSGYVVEYDEDR